MRKLDKQVKTYLLRNVEQTRRHLDIRDNTLRDEESEEGEHDPEDQVQVRLDSGEIVTVRSRTKRTRERRRLTTPTTRWLTDAELYEVSEYDKPEARSCLRAKQYSLQFENRWFELNQRNEHESKMEMYARMERHMEFLDSDAVPF